MDVQAITALVVAVAGLVTAVATLVSHLRLRGQVKAQTPPVAPPGPGA